MKFRRAGSAAGHLPLRRFHRYNETHELREVRSNCYPGKGVAKAVENFRGEIAPTPIGKNIPDQTHIDEIMIGLDETPTRAD